VEDGEVGVGTPSAHVAFERRALRRPLERAQKRSDGRSQRPSALT
jgi:hypothetical protein